MCIYIYYYLTRVGIWAYLPFSVWMFFFPKSLLILLLWMRDRLFLDLRYIYMYIYTYCYLTRTGIWTYSPFCVWIFSFFSSSLLILLLWVPFFLTGWKKPSPLNRELIQQQALKTFPHVVLLLKNTAQIPSGRAEFFFSH